MIFKGTRYELSIVDFTIFIGVHKIHQMFQLFKTHLIFNILVLDHVVIEFLEG